MALRRDMQLTGAHGARGRGWIGLGRAVAAIGHGLSRGLAGLAGERVAAQAPIARPRTHALMQPSDLFVQGLRDDSNLELDWLWLASQVSRDSERLYCYERALAINPRSAIARDELAAVGRG